ncbi:MAG: pyruvate dehydrogenase (acetyl-transferring), homodimeric type [Gammaproteobacteria bacterium]|nr:pyruvate dehydrogenase (acetyl-transferring), homodimeric type [Gammaproteobacteria bacterium]
MSQDIDPIETQEWLDSLESVLEEEGAERALFLLSQLNQKAGSLGMGSAYQTLHTAYQNTIPTSAQPAYPGDLILEGKLESLIRWNAALIVAGANHEDSTLGGHISTFASSSTLYQIGFDHFFHAKTAQHGGDLILVQGHASPGIYARSFLEGRLSVDQLKNFRREVDGKGVSSYPHPWLMPDYWQFPTVSMGLGPMLAIYEARFMKYLHARHLADTAARKVWAFCGDGEMDEPESTGGLTRAGREKLDNLIFVVNCNLQRLDGLVNGNGKIMQELESTFKGAGWNVIKVVWGSNWEPLFAKDEQGFLLQRLTDACDGDFQTYQARGGAYMREHLFNTPELKALVADLSDAQLQNLERGGHDPLKVYAAYKAATEHVGQPTVILTKTIKGYGLGTAGESKNIAHNQKKLTVDELKYFRDRFEIPVTDTEVEAYKLHRPAETTPEMQYLQARRQDLGGYLPLRHENTTPFKIPAYQDFAARLLLGTGEGREMSTTTAYVQILTALCKDPNIGKFIVPITPDESRTFGMEGLFRQLGIYNPEGQKYEPEDRDQVMYYKEATDGQILQEGLNEGGAISSWIAAATSYSVHDLPMIPFYIYYSMFGFQRIGDFAWLAGDMRAKGFLLGATAGRTSLNGEGLQHEDGHSHIQAGLVPNCKSYDPTYAYELAVIIWHGLTRMYAESHDEYYYITMMNENYPHHPMPKGVEQGIIKGLYCLKKSANPDAKKQVSLMGSGTILREAEAAAELLLKDFKVTSDIWSATSCNELYRDAMDAKRFNDLNPEKKAKTAFVTEAFKSGHGPIIAATDYVKLYTEQLREFMPRRYVCLGTDGFGRSDTRPKLREHFEVDANHIAYHAIKALFDDGVMSLEEVKKARQLYQINADKKNPLEA